jgi:hypothetical protein
VGIEFKSTQDTALATIASSPTRRSQMTHPPPRGGAKSELSGGHSAGFVEITRDFINPIGQNQ